MEDFVNRVISVSYKLSKARITLYIMSESELSLSHSKCESEIIIASNKDDYVSGEKKIFTIFTKLLDFQKYIIDKISDVIVKTHYYYILYSNKTFNIALIIIRVQLTCCCCSRTKLCCRSWSCCRLY